jgi:hypothetical protein
MQGISVGELSLVAKNIFEILGGRSVFDWANEHLAFLAVLMAVAWMLLRQKRV